MWRYNLPVKDSIFWNKFSNTSSSTITNIPSFLAVKDSYDSLVYFEYTGTSKIFRLVIGSEKCVDLFTLDKYEKQLYADLNNRKFKIEDTISQKIETTSGRRYQYHKLAGNGAIQETLQSIL
jgi:hypothetical protein